MTAVVASLRADAIGAKGFKVSRSYFAKGVAGGKVSVNGKVAGKSTEVAPGDVLVADGLGRITLVGVEGTTRRGNMKVNMEVERSKGT